MEVIERKKEQWQHWQVFQQANTLIFCLRNRKKTKKIEINIFVRKSYKTSFLISATKCWANYPFFLAYLLIMATITLPIQYPQKCPNPNTFSGYFQVSRGCHGVRWPRMGMTGNVAPRPGSDWVGFPASVGLYSHLPVPSWGGGRGGSCSIRRLFQGVRRQKRVKPAVQVCSVQASAWIVCWFRRAWRSPRPGKSSLLTEVGSRARDNIFEQTLNLSHLAIENPYINYFLCCAVRSPYSDYCSV